MDWKKATYKPTETNFNTANAVIPGTKEYQYVMMTIDDLAEQLLILQDNNVPIIFRPYHEAEGNGGLKGEGAWFWWASAGAEVYKQLWEMLYTELTQTYGLHNLIWTYNSYVYSTSPAWYPGDNMVDIVGYDKYNTIYNRYDGLSGVPNEDAITTIFYQLVDLTNGTKMVAMTENDTIPSVKNLTEEKSGWLYFCPWYGEHLMSSAFNYPATLKNLYQSSYVITLDELPNLKVDHQTPTPTVTPSPTVTPTPTVTPIAGDLVIQSYNGNTSASTNGLSPKFKLLNAGTADINISDIKLRYYYTIDGEISQNFWCDWASIGSANVKSEFVKLTNPSTGADYYLEVSFTASAGTLKPGQSAEIQARFSKSNWSNYNQENDYSFNASSNQYVNSEKVTGYINNKRVWGVEP